MGLYSLDVVDAVGTETASGCVVLSIFDSWDWSDEREHLLALQSKFNSYFAFVESGQLHETYPASEGKSLRIDLISRYPLPIVAVDFLNIAEATAMELAISLSWKTHAAAIST